MPRAPFFNAIPVHFITAIVIGIEHVKLGCIYNYRCLGETTATAGRRGRGHPPTTLRNGRAKIFKEA